MCSPASVCFEIALVGSQRKWSGGPMQDVEHASVLGIDPPGSLVAGLVHSITTLIVDSVRSLAPRTWPPWESESAIKSSVARLSRSPGSTFGTPGG